MKLILLTAVLIVAVASPATAERLSIGVGFADLRTTTLATPAGELVEIPRYTRQEVGIDGTYALTDRLTVLGSLVVYRGAAIDQFDEASGVGDLRMGLHAHVGQRRGWFMAVRGVVQAPTGDPTTGGALLPTGSGAWEGEGVFSLARALVGERLTGAVEVGHHVRGKGLRDGLIYGGRVGVRANDRVTVAWVIRGLQVYERRPGPASIASASGLGDGVTYTTFGPVASIRLAESLALNLAVNRSAHARNFATGTGVWIGATFTH